MKCTINVYKNATEVVDTKKRNCTVHSIDTGYLLTLTRKSTKSDKPEDKTCATIIKDGTVSTVIRLSKEGAELLLIALNKQLNR